MPTFCVCVKIALEAVLDPVAIVTKQGKLILGKLRRLSPLQFGIVFSLISNLLRWINEIKRIITQQKYSLIEELIFLAQL